MDAAIWERFFLSLRTILGSFGDVLALLQRSLASVRLKRTPMGQRNYVAIQLTFI